MPLNQAQLKYLKQQAHNLNPVVLLGSNGYTENVAREIDSALRTHGLIKVRLAETDKDEKKAQAEAITADAKAELIQSIGRIIAIYRDSPKAEITNIIKHL